ncbi:unnamed protein product [Sphenostylis stenocarpa]|uniref:DUF4005 domain-containing protein n=1 Tax=Sphenostylis stenocarpa TaxID=92480 RepID=A0AA86V7S2_9FABA|nr:unnamed protein product [Sphenostylis stenocarpa]
MDQKLASGEEIVVKKPSSNKDVLVVSSEASISTPISGANVTKRKLSEKEVISISSNDGVILATGDEQANAQSLANFYSGDHDEKSRLTETAIIIQAALRGYQARGTYKTLKVIIPLQAYIRGQLVRRQAISALLCVKAIVRFQALARGYKVRHSDIGLAVQKIFKDTKLPKFKGVVTSTQAVNFSDNVFVHKYDGDGVVALGGYKNEGKWNGVWENELKESIRIACTLNPRYAFQLLASSRSAASPHRKYNTGESKLDWEWLDRWTKSHFWVPLQEAQKPDSVSDKQNGSSQIKGNARKAPASRIGNDLVSDSNKHKRYPKKDSNLAFHSAKEHTQKELEKRSSMKSQIQNVSDKSEAANEKRTHITRKVSVHTKVNDVPEEDATASSEKIKHLVVSKSEEYDLEKSPGQQAEKHDNNGSCNDTNAPFQSSLRNSKDGGVIEELNNVNCKNFHRRASLPANFTDHESVLHNNSPRRPSYMAPTESTKAKLRGQCSPRSVSDLADISSITRRLSLSSSLSGKLGSFSPRSDRFAALNNKIRTDRSLSSSRDGTGKNLGFCTLFTYS